MVFKEIVVDILEFVDFLKKEDNVKMEKKYVNGVVLKFQQFQLKIVDLNQ
jgi:hypothetical protein